MTWAKLSDTFIDDATLLGLPRGCRLLFVEGIVWSCKHEQDGLIPAHVLHRITDEPDAAAAAEQLVKAGLWTAHDDGWEIVGFLEQQRSSEDIRKIRQLAAVRQRRQRQHQQGDHGLCDPKFCRAASRVTDGVTHAVTNGVSHGSLTRPDPTRPLGRGGEGRADVRAPLGSPGVARQKGQPGFTVTMPGASEAEAS
jgi:hypothetical protein